MYRTNSDLQKIMVDHQLSCADIAGTLGIPLEQVEGWVAEPVSKDFKQMPESELRLLQYSLMTENTRYHLF